MDPSGCWTREVNLFQKTLASGHATIGPDVWWRGLLGQLAPALETTSFRIWRFLLLVDMSPDSAGR